MNALNQAGQLKRQRQQMGMDLIKQAAQQSHQSNQQKEKPSK